MSPIPQRYNLKAIHNFSNSTSCLSAGVTNTSKIQSESNSQHDWNRCHSRKRCHQYLKDTIWKQFTTPSYLMVGSPLVSPIPQRYNLKAIHNRELEMLKWQFGVTNTSKIQSESNSQLNGDVVICQKWCHQYLKDTIWKQFTTPL